jgi:hypothetical protein
MSALISTLRGLAGMPEVDWNEFDYAIVESAAAVKFLGSANMAAEAPKYPRGLAFGNSAELRWVRRNDGLLHLVYISETGRALWADARQQELRRMPGVQPERILLWGEGDGRIPVALQYPANAPAGAGRLAVRIQHYDLCGTPIFRCVGLTREKEQA